MIEKYINIDNEKDILRIGLKDKNDKPILNEKGEVVCWAFDLADIELPLKYNKIEFQHRKNQEYVRNMFIVVNKKQDHKGKYLLSSNDEEKAKILLEYYKKEEEILDVFLGENGTKKFLNGRNYYWDMFDDISKSLEPILPLLKGTMDNIENRIKDKYKSVKEDNVLE